jgi:broad specificity phosphatase PhoE
VRQAQYWRAHFDRICLAGVYASGLERALQTAALSITRPACIIPGFNERRFGEWEGRTWEELRAEDPDFDRRWNEDHFIPQGGESRQALFDRVGAALEESVLQHRSGDEVAVVAHGASGRAILCRLLGYSPRDRTILTVLKNGSLSIVDRGPAGWNLAGQFFVDA